MGEETTLKNDVTVRRYVAEDLRALYAIEEACFEPQVRFSRALMRSLAADPDCRIWVGIVDGVRAGFAIVGVKGPEQYKGLVEAKAAYLWTIEVLPGFRRMGVAAALMSRVEESAREAGCLAIELHVMRENLDAVALYEGAGYVRVGVEVGFYGRGKDGLRYRKPI